MLAAASSVPAGAPAQRAAAAGAPLAIVSSLERLVPDVTGTAGTRIEAAASGAASHVDQLIYTARFTNRSGELLDGVRITSRIPAELRYVPESASGPASTILFSTDEARTFGPPAELTVARADGTRRAADAADYTHVRWVVDGALDPGATGVVRFAAVAR